MGATSTYKIIKSLSPKEVFDILTRDICHWKSKELIDVHWDRNTKVDKLSIYLSDSGLQIYTTKEISESLMNVFKSWELFYEVWSRWYGGDTYIVGFNYTYESFDILYRESKINNILGENGLHTI